jgi:hypothetical protein
MEQTDFLCDGSNSITILHVRLWEFDGGDFFFGDHFCTYRYSDSNKVDDQPVTRSPAE